MKNFKDAIWKEKVTKLIQSIQSNEIKFVRLNFTDINGKIKSLAISSKNLDQIFDNGQSFDGSAITGYRAIEESDMILYPDPSAFSIIPWKTKDRPSCRLMCDVYTPDNKRFEGDPRYILERAVSKCQESGMTYICAPELEFFILKTGGADGSPKPIDVGGYFDFLPEEITDDLRREIAEAAEAFDIEIEISHHESALGQNEIDFKYDNALSTADRTVTMKMVTKVVAAKNGFKASYMPKPFMGINGSGMHVHQSMWDNAMTKNLFFSDNERTGYLSNTAMHFIGGQLTHGRETCAVLASWPNSYKRLVPGYEAPVYIAWAFKNRSPLIRVPNFGGRSYAARCEIRNPDPAGNPYLQFAVLLMSGLEGIKKKMDPGDATEVNVYRMSYEERKARRIVSLPESLKEALDEMERSEFIRDVLGETAFLNFIVEKRKEWDLYKINVTNWEFERYLSL
jgi:glutamine synthetase